MGEIRPSVPAETRECEERLLMNAIVNGLMHRRVLVQIKPSPHPKPTALSN